MTVLPRMALAGLVLLALTAMELLPRGDLPPATREPALPVPGLPPTTMMLRLDGNQAMLAKPGQAMVVNIWASWCGPCRVEMPSLQGLADRLASSSVTVVGISIDRDRIFLREYLRSIGIGFADFIDPEQSVARGVLGVDSVPQTLLIASDGTILRRVHGARDWNSPESLVEIDTVLGGVIPFRPTVADPRQ